MGDEVRKDQLGHRKRLRTRFLKDLGRAMEDYELLELILTQAIPRGDVKPLAKQLISYFKSYAGVLSATPEELQKVEGVGEAAIVAIKLSQQSALRLLKQEAFKGHILNNWQNLIDYLQAAMGREKVEQLRVLYLNQRNHLIADEVQNIGTVNHTPLYPREIVKRALDLSAVAIIIVHNHPSGDPAPSQEDIQMTNMVKDAGSNLGITLHDHIIIGHNNYLSFKTQGLL
ncbi:RadC family protein [Curvivirga aplysinae]|uniref:RadC family protein n=1 Tax=Curvivirga aplysinae TaxID=2529852 RepID=UPI0012BD16F4|nr:DNA repair protein RadC [Curvivirga aplysinae]MTI10481.1 JAB domain-containing protein [Curvivirga aplysinae]